MATFHPFPRLPLEIRIQIWGSAIVEGRVLKVRELRSRASYWSPTPVPAVTRASQESRKYCSYQKAFIVDQSPHYIWTSFESDIIQMNSAQMNKLVAGNSLEKKEVRHLRIELVHELGWDQSELFYHDYSRKIRNFPKLGRCDVLVNNGLYAWGNLINETYWGACPKSNVRIIDAKTGEWIDAETAGPYQDYIDTGHGETRDYLRDVDYDVEWEEAEGDERYEAMMKMKAPLPRIDLGY
ncbi:Nn.00g019860.m01.CDS01 [Neocucurbitaria sp. VM-36]